MSKPKGSASGKSSPESKDKSKSKAKLPPATAATPASEASAPPAKAKKSEKKKEKDAKKPKSGSKSKADKAAPSATAAVTPTPPTAAAAAPAPEPAATSRSAPPVPTPDDAELDLDLDAALALEKTESESATRAAYTTRKAPKPEVETIEIEGGDLDEFVEGIGRQAPLAKVIFQKAPADEVEEAGGDGLKEFIQGIEGFMAEQLLWIPSGAYRLSAVLHAAQNVPADAPTDRFPLVIMSHGFTGSKLESGRLFVTTARALAARGMSVLRFDFMGSGDSTGEFFEMTPNTEIADLHAVIRWARENDFGPIGLLGLSFGGAVSICTAAQLQKTEPGAIKALATWSSVPGFKFWRPSPDGNAPLPAPHSNGLQVGPAFYTDRPAVDVPESYQSLTIPKFQVQGDKDIEGFRENFAEFFKAAPKPKKHTVLRGADHVFTTWSHRLKVIDLTADWLAEQLLDLE